MAKRKVMRVRKDKNGNISTLCNPDSDWSPIPAAEVIREINHDIHNYYVEMDRKEVDIVVAEGPSGEYLRTDPEETSENYLLELPECEL